MNRANPDVSKVLVCIVPPNKSLNRTAPVSARSVGGHFSSCCCSGRRLCKSGAAPHLPAIRPLDIPDLLSFNLVLAETGSQNQSGRCTTPPAFAFRAGHRTARIDCRLFSPMPPGVLHLWPRRCIMYQVRAGVGKITKGVCEERK